MIERWIFIIIVLILGKSYIRRTDDKIDKIINDIRKQEKEKEE